MPVVINEFEISPEAPAAPTRAEGAPADGAPGGRGKDVRREIDKHLRQRAERASRLRAV